MTRKLSSAVMVAVVLLSSVAGGVALGGTATALRDGAAATYPLAPGTDALGTAVVVAEPGDNVAQNGIKRITLDFSGRNFDGSVENVTADDIFVVVRGGQRIEISNDGGDIVDVSGIRVSKNSAGDQLTVILPRPIRPRFASDSPNTGAEVSVKFDNFTTPSQPGSYTIEGTLTDPSGNSDGPVALSYPVSAADVSMSNQSLSQFSSSQQLNVSAAIPGGGYVGIFTVGPDGSPNELVGSTNTSTSPSPQNYTIDVSGNVTETQQLVAVAYTESVGRSAGLRADESFAPTQDDPLVVNGNLVNSTATVSTLDVDGRLEAGSEYDQGQRLYFSGGDSSTGYQIRTIQNGELGPAATQFQTAANGTAIVDTSELQQGQYAISRVDDGSLVSLDNDSTTNPGDDSFFVTGQQATTTAAQTTSGDDGGAATATDGGSAATADGGDSGTDAGAGGAGDGASTGTSGGEQESTDSGGPGFGIVIALVAVLAAALLAMRRH